MAWAEDRALLGSNLSAVPGAKIGDWGDCLSPHSFFISEIGTKAINPGVWGRAPAACALLSGFHSVASARHAAYVFRSINMCQIIVASFRITATLAILAPRLRLIRLRHSRNRRSFRKAL
jgi:hypothetical protein